MVYDVIFTEFVTSLFPMDIRYRTTPKAMRHWELLKIYDVMDLDNTPEISEHMECLIKTHPGIVTPAIIREAVALRKTMTDKEWAKEQISLQCNKDKGCTIEQIRNLFIHSTAKCEEGIFMHRVSHIIAEQGHQIFKDMENDGFLERKTPNNT
jgi:hypothetical protein